MRKLLGVIGGLGPMATAVFLERVVTLTDAATDQEHIDMAVRHCPGIPDRSSYLLGKSPKSPLPMLIEQAKALAEQNVCAIALPCMTAHAFHDELERESGVSVLNTIEATARCCRAAGKERVALLATEGTIHAQLFQRALRAQGITPLLPDEETQAAVTQLIFASVKAGKSGTDALTSLVQRIAASPAQAVILGCTELSVAACGSALQADPFVIDTLDILACLSIRACGGRLRPSAQRYGLPKEDVCTERMF